MLASSPIVSSTCVLQCSTSVATAQASPSDHCDLEAGRARFLGAAVARACADNALQIHGRNGYATECRISRVFAMLTSLNIFEGAAEIQAQVGARRLLSE